MSRLVSSGNRPQLSVVMIVRDAEDLVEASISSVLGIADEIVVVDTGSVDRTIDVARAHGAVVVERAWDDDFSAARNYGLRSAHGDWILWLDAGENLSHETATQLRTFLDNTADNSKAYLLYVQIPPEPDKRNVSGECAARIRLVPHLEGLKFEGRIREQLKSSLDSAGITVALSDFVINRSEHDHLSHVIVKRAERDLRIAKREVDQQGERPEVLTAAGESLMRLERLEEAAFAFRRAIELSQHGSTEMLEAYYGLLTTFDEDPDLIQSQIDVCLDALNIFPLDAQLLCGMGSYLLKQQRLELATRCYQVAAQFGQVDQAAWHLPDVVDVAAISTSLALQLQNKDDQAQSILEETLRKHPNSERVRRQLIELHIKHGKSEPALQLFDGLPQSIPNREALRSAVRGALMAAGRNWQAALPYLKTAFSAGCRDPLCLRWLAVSYLSTGVIEAAESILQTWLKLDPANPEIPSYLNAVADRRSKVSQVDMPEHTPPASSPLPSSALPSSPLPGSSDRRDLESPSDESERQRRIDPASPLPSRRSKPTKVPAPPN